MPDLRGLGLGLLTGTFLSLVGKVESALLGVKSDSALDFCSNRFTRDVVAGIGVASVGSSPSISENLRGLGATAGRAAGGEGRARDAAKTAACCEADLVCRGPVCCCDTARIGVRDRSSVVDLPGLDPPLTLLAGDRVGGGNGDLEGVR